MILDIHVIDILRKFADDTILLTRQKPTLINQRTWASCNDSNKDNIHLIRWYWRDNLLHIGLVREKGMETVDKVEQLSSSSLRFALVLLRYVARD